MDKDKLLQQAAELIIEAQQISDVIMSPMWNLRATTWLNEYRHQLPVKASSK